MIKDTRTVPFCDRWNPYQRFTVHEHELMAWFERYGSWAFYDGFQWKPKHKHVFGINDAIIEVWFERTMA